MAGKYYDQWLTKQVAINFVWYTALQNVTKYSHMYALFIVSMNMLLDVITGHGFLSLTDDNKCHVMPGQVADGFLAYLWH